MLRNAKAWLFKKPVWLFPIITVWPLKVLLHSKYYFILAKKINCSGVTEITCLMQCSRLRGFSFHEVSTVHRGFSQPPLKTFDKMSFLRKQIYMAWISPKTPTNKQLIFGNIAHISQITATSLQWPHPFFFPPDSPYIVSCLNLSTTATATEAHPQQPKITSRQRPKKVKNCYEIWSYGASIINRSNHTLIVFH